MDARARILGHPGCDEFQDGFVGQRFGRAEIIGDDEHGKRLTGRGTMRWVLLRAEGRRSGVPH